MFSLALDIVNIFYFSILTGVKWFLIVALICVSLRAELKDSPLFFPWEKGSHCLTLLPRLECSGVILAHFNLRLLSSSDPLTSASCVVQLGLQAHIATSSWYLCFLVETGFRHVGQAGLEPLTSVDPPAPASQSAGITGMSLYAGPNNDKDLFMHSLAIHIQ